MRKRLLTLWTRQPYYRTGEAHVLHVRDTTLHFYRYQCKFYVAHWEGGNVMSEKFKSFIEQITEKTGLDAKRVETAARDYFTNVD